VKMENKRLQRCLCAKRAHASISLRTRARAHAAFLSEEESGEVRLEDEEKHTAAVNRD